jgi:hypothetical protein
VAGTTAIEGDDEIIRNYEVGTFPNHEAGTTTGDDQVSGTLTNDGMKSGIVTMFD